MRQASRPRTGRPGSETEGEAGCLPSHRRRPGTRPPVQGAGRLPCDEGLRRSIIAGSRDRRLSLIRRLASLRRDSRSRSALFSWPSSSAFSIYTTSVQLRTACELPAHRASGMSVSALRELTQQKMAGSWWDIGVLSGRVSTDFTQHSVSHCLATYHNLRWGGAYLAFDRPIDGVQTAASPAVCAVATPAIRSAFPSGLAQTRPSLRSSTRATSGSYRQVRPSPVSAPSGRAPEATGALERRLPTGFARPALTRNSLQPCNALRRCAPLLYRLTPADRTGCIPYPCTSTRRSHDDSHR